MIEHKFEKVSNGYKISSGEQTISYSFCGSVPDSVVNTPQSIKGQRVKTLMGFYTDSNFRNQGYGKRLIEHIVEQETLAGTQHLTLGVAKNNEYAIRLYESCGFSVSGDLATIGNGSYHLMHLNLFKI